MKPIKAWAIGNRNGDIAESDRLTKQVEVYRRKDVAEIEAKSCNGTIYPVIITQPPVLTEGEREAMSILLESMKLTPDTDSPPGLYENLANVLRKLMFAVGMEE